MAYRKSHGAGKGAAPRIEVLPPDELPDPVAVDQAALSGPEVHRFEGKFTTASGALAGRNGGRARGRNVRLARSLGLRSITENEAFRPYLDDAAKFREYHCIELAAMSGGDCGSGPSSLIASAALQLAASRYLYDVGMQTGDTATLKAASQLSNDSRQNIMASYELSVRQARLRAEQGEDDITALRLATVRAREAAK